MEDNSIEQPVCKLGSNTEGVTPVGRLRQAISKWESIGANKVVLDIVQNGYKLPLHTIPDVTRLKNNKSALQNKEFVEEEIGKLLAKGCIT